MITRSSDTAVNNATQEVQWGVLISLPDVDFSEVEPKINRAAAASSVVNANGAVGAGTATLMYRTETRGQWSRDLSTPGEQWGVRYDWPSYSEVRECTDRVDAEHSVLYYSGESSPCVVTRTATFGEWRAVPASEA